jgi:O-antigen ligase
MKTSIVFGSAHSQYMDVFFRTGFFGLFIYMTLIFFILKEMYLKDKGLFFGFVSILVYGMFHETFKESQGGFIFAFFLGYASYLHKSRKKINV